MPKIISKPGLQGTFMIAEEDHTLGNFLASALQRDTRVQYAGYKVMENARPPYLVVSLQLYGSRELPDQQAVLGDTLQDSQNMVSSLQAQFERELDRLRQQCEDGKEPDLEVELEDLTLSS